MEKDKIVALLLLLKRSEPKADAEGWITVSSILKDLVAAAPDDLVEKKLSHESLLVRITDGGRLLLKYA